MDNINVFSMELSHDCNQIRTDASNVCHGFEGVHDKVDPVPVAKLCPISLRLVEPVNLGGIKSQLKPATFTWTITFSTKRI